MTMEALGIEYLKYRQQELTADLHVVIDDYEIRACKGSVGNCPIAQELIEMLKLRPWTWSDFIVNDDIEISDQYFRIRVNGTYYRWNPTHKVKHWILQFDEWFDNPEGRIPPPIEFDMNFHLEKINDFYRLS